MSSTPKPHPAVQRLNKAYVQVPVSPLSLSNYRPLGTPTHVAGSSKLKENTPLRPFQLAMIQHASSSASLKRKVSEREPSSLIFDGVNPSAKKLKLSTSVTPLKATQIKPLMPAGNACAEFPNGSAYCHQCNKKRDVTATIRCTVVERYHTTKDKDAKERLCANKYCRSCLKNRYDEDIEVFKTQAQGPNGAASAFKCPRCRGVCNCPRCRKSKGLEAIGYLTKKPRDPVTASNATKKLKVEVVIDAKPTLVTKPKPKALPLLKWSPLTVSLTQVQTDQRIFIREFALRFSDLLDPVIAKTHLEELELIGGRPRRHEDEEETASWVSEMCVKALVVGLLGLLAKDHDSYISKMIKTTVKDLRSAGGNLNKIWAALASLRDDIASISSSESSTIDSLIDVGTSLTFPNPSPPPASTMANARSLRSLRLSEDSVNIVQSSQMIPVLVSLIHSVLETAIIREDIDQSMKDSKDFARDAKEATRIENERWEKERNGMETKDKAQKSENKVKRSIHKDQILNIDNSLKIISRSFVPRFMTLGTDDEGRTYYALSPSAAEREAAFEYLEVASSEKPTKPKKKGRILASEDRSEMREWSWFIAVWGKRPPLSAEEEPSALSRKMEVDDIDAESDDEEADADVEKWWGFWEPEEIVKVAEWISIKSGLEDDSEVPDGQSGSSSFSKSSVSNKEKSSSRLSPRVEHLKRLVAELKDYATVLQWRVREDKCTLVSRFPSSTQADQGPSDAKGKGKLSIGVESGIEQ